MGLAILRPEKSQLFGLGSHQEKYQPDQGSVPSPDRRNGLAATSLQIFRNSFLASNLVRKAGARPSVLAGSFRRLKIVRTSHSSPSLFNTASSIEKVSERDGPEMGEEDGGAASKGQKKGRLSVERIYQKKSQLEHILLRPDTYIGSVQPVTGGMFVLNEEGQIENREITYCPGLYKIFDEILVNAADNKQRDKKMDTIKIDIKPEENMIRIYNNGKGIPVVHHEKENMYVPTMIFGHLLTSSNFNDED